MQASLDALDDLVVLINKRLPEKERRILLGAAAKVYGHGGEKRVKDLTGIAFSTLHRGKADAEGELAKPVAQEANSTPVSLSESPDAPEEDKKPRHTGSGLKVQTVNCFDSLQVAILGKPPERKKSPIQESKIGDSSEGSYPQRL